MPRLTHGPLVGYRAGAIRDPCEEKRLSGLLAGSTASAKPEDFARPWSRWRQQRDIASWAIWFAARLVASGRRCR